MFEEHAFPQSHTCKNTQAFFGQKHVIFESGFYDSLRKELSDYQTLKVSFEDLFIAMLSLS